MFVSCPFCDSYVEPDETGRCPACTAPLGDAIEEKEAAIAAAEEAEREREAAEAEAERKQETTEKIIGAVGAVAAAVLGGAASRSVHPQQGGMRPPSPQGGRGGHASAPGGMGGHMPPPGGMGGRRPPSGGGFMV